MEEISLNAEMQKSSAQLLELFHQHRKAKEKAI